MVMVDVGGVGEREPSEVARCFVRDDDGGGRLFAFESARRCKACGAGFVRRDGFERDAVGFFLGLFVDLANHTMGIHAAATTLLAYIRPRLLMLTSNREQIDDIQGKQKISDFGWFFKYVFISTAIFNTVLILCETFSVHNFVITGLRILFSTLASTFFILLYYFIALKKKQNQ